MFVKVWAYVHDARRLHNMTQFSFTNGSMVFTYLESMDLIATTIMTARISKTGYNQRDAFLLRFICDEVPWNLDMLRDWLIKFLLKWRAKLGKVGTCAVKNFPFFFLCNIIRIVIMKQLSMRSTLMKCIYIHICKMITDKSY
jgi:hypothetical protein